jgi:hypothetical protein
MNVNTEHLAAAGILTSFVHPCQVCGQTVRVVDSEAKAHVCQTFSAGDSLAAYAWWQGYDAAMASIDRRHIADLRPDGYGLQHPLACRPNLLDCPVERACRALDHPLVDEPGRYVVDVTPGGEFTIVERAEP